MKRLNLKKETLADLTAEDLVAVGGGGADGASRNIALPTDHCVIVISGTCFQYFTNGCTLC